MSQSITLNIPDSLLQPLQRMARATRRPLEDLLLTALQASLPPLDGLPAGVAEELELLETLDDQVLWRIIGERVAEEDAQAIHGLLGGRRERELSGAEQERLDAAQRRADLVMLRKARGGHPASARETHSDGSRVGTSARPSRMSRRKISTALRHKISRQARRRCGYCLTGETLVGMPMEVEHLSPVAVGGRAQEENLWLSCRRCNEYKGAQTHAIDPETGERVALFNPRAQKWAEHFGWNDDGTRVICLSPVGRATVEALRMNNLLIVQTRRLWVSVGWWPPID